MHEACANGRERIFKILLRHRASISLRTMLAHQTPLHVAAANGQDTIVKLLLRAGADPEARDGNGRLPIHCATTGGVVYAIVGDFAPGCSCSCSYL